MLKVKPKMYLVVKKKVAGKKIAFGRAKCVRCLCGFADGLHGKRSGLY
jgi:hypothetical protein